MDEIREMFRNVLQEVMEAELETTLGYEKYERPSENGDASVSKNYRNGYSKNIVKTQLGEVEIASRATAMGSTRRKYQKPQRHAPALPGL